MPAYANLHLALEAMRVRALSHAQGSDQLERTPPYDGDSESTEPPRILILGPPNSGKTSVAKILINYAVRAGQDWCPFLINVDPSEVSSVQLLCASISDGVLGRSYASRHSFCFTHFRTSSDIHPCTYTWFFFNKCPNSRVVKFASPSCLLVRTRGDKTKWAPLRQIDPELGRERLGQAGGRPTRLFLLQLFFICTAD